MEWIIALATGLGLATASGLNAYLPLLTIGIFARLGMIQLAEPFDLLSNVFVLLVIAVLAVLDFAGDKLPAVDSFFHAAGIVINPIAGAILALASQGDLATVSPILVGAAGLLAAGSTHAARASVRPVVTAATGGTGNPIISTIEDVTSLVLSILAILVPIFAVVLAIVLAFVAYRVFRRAAKIWRKKDDAVVNGKV
ncbi:DUF4126 domain-containing protein [Candidatus Chloroploca asiatica]|uniref:DUF4126 domain-containing protein n=1 Tax=Candidatus Chloroploca asiatica TaxID=1506545 RepID=A0A2H3KN35_9CHLR|nr:DUF4126 domain-containing protein [Candidatus Chloroploca asiatica]PDV98774.1 hypothetical protein A9Q02_02240 [Candidatus Chloroploca asiatica]